MANLSSYYSNWKEERELLQSESVCIVPFECCFLSTCPLPDGVKSADAIESAVSINLESSSPFPLEDIFWGYYVNQLDATIYIFSALKSRVKNISEEATGATYIIPDFVLPLLDNSINKAVLCHGESKVNFLREPTGEIHLSSGDSPLENTPILEITDARSVREFGLIIDYKWSDHDSSFSKTIELPFHNALLSSINMQSGILKKTNKQNKLIANISRITFLSATAIIVLSICGLFTTKSMQLRASQVAKNLKEQETRVENIQQKDARANELELFANRKQAYFRGLNQLNALRPDSILFQSLYASEGENFEIQCIATSLDELNKFRKQLSDSSLFKTVNVDGTHVGDNDKIHFSLSLSFKKL